MIDNVRGICSGRQCKRKSALTANVRENLYCKRIYEQTTDVRGICTDRVRGYLHSLQMWDAIYSDSQCKSKSALTSNVRGNLH